MRNGTITSMNKALSEKQIASHLSKLPKQWYIAGDGKLSRDFKFDDFNQAGSFVRCVAKAANRLDHHPKIEWEYTAVRISVITHELSALSQLDFKLAARVEKCHSKS